MINRWKNRSRRGKTVRIVVLIALLTAAGCGGDNNDDEGSTATTTTAGAPTTVATMATGPTTTRSIRCLDFPITGGAINASAESLITNSDTGKRKIEGAITKAAAGKPNGGGLWSSLDSFSEQATNFPRNTSYLKAFLNTDGSQESRDCVA